MYNMVTIIPGPSPSTTHRVIELYVIILRVCVVIPFSRSLNTWGVHRPQAKSN